MAVGNVFTFIVYTLTALVHEMGHSFEASKRGYALNQMLLTPFGAVVTGDADFDFKDQIRIALGGPLVNLVVGALLVCAWWCFPETYAYTEIMATANFSMAIVNLLPCYPLDGGRILFSLLVKKVKEGRAFLVCKILGVGFSAIVFAFFILTLEGGANYSVLLFSIFMFFGAISSKKENRYIKIYTGVSIRKLRRGVRYNKVAIEKSATIKMLVSVLDTSAVNEVVVFSNGEIIKVLDQKAIESLLEKAVYREKLSKYL